VYKEKAKSMAEDQFKERMLKNDSNFLKMAVNGLLVPEQA
jgi:hypothetical protein